MKRAGGWLVRRAANAVGGFVGGIAIAVLVVAAADAAERRLADQGGE